MSQSAFTAAILLAGFLLFLAAKNRLNTYSAVLWGNTKAAAPTGGASSGGGILGTAIKLAPEALALAA